MAVPAASRALPTVSRANRRREQPFAPPGAAGTSSDVRSKMSPCGKWAGAATAPADAAHAIGLPEHAPVRGLNPSLLLVPPERSAGDQVRPCAGGRESVTPAIRFSASPVTRWWCRLPSTACRSATNSTVLRSAGARNLRAARRPLRLRAAKPFHSAARLGRSRYLNSEITRRALELLVE